MVARHLEAERGVPVLSIYGIPFGGETLTSLAPAPCELLARLDAAESIRERL
jgi:hypothetical protein